MRELCWQVYWQKKKEKEIHEGNVIIKTKKEMTNLLSSINRIAPLANHWADELKR